MTQYMLLFSLGPVQSFIAQARKTRDLWLGSYLLSLLMEAGMLGIAEEKFIFPAKQKIERNIPDLPNKYIAIFSSLEEAQAAATQSETQIHTCWQNLCNDVWGDIIVRYPSSVTKKLRDIWDRQTNPATFFEIFWSIASQNENEAYKSWLGRAQEALAARKQLRHVTMHDNVIFAAVKPGTFLLDEPGEKSTISGEREALHGNQPPREFWRQLSDKLIEARLTTEISTAGEERLDAIDTVKRFAYRTKILHDKNIDAGFPSTSTIATASFVEQLLAKQQLFSREAKEALGRWLNATNGSLSEMSPLTLPYLYTMSGQQENTRHILRRDGDCYFPETFTAERLEKDYAIKPRKEAEDRAKRGLAALKDLLGEADKLQISRPTPYYAMIQMDGDKMGTLLGKVEDKDEHKNISGALSIFSREHAPKLVERKYPGRLIYAGGDDVFALAPLARDLTEQTSESELVTVLNLVDQLQRQYVQDVSFHVQGGERKQQVTASVGIAIAHHYTSLSYVRRMSKGAEERAKKHYGRNALVVTILRRSGEQTQVGCKWHYAGLAEDAQPIKLFSKFYDMFKNDILSPKCVYTLLEEATTLTSFLTKEAQTSEVKRVLIRQTNTNKQKPFSKEDAALLAQYIVEMAHAMDVTADEEYKKNHPDKESGEIKSAELHSMQRRYGLVEVLGWLLVMNFLARKEQA